MTMTRTRKTHDLRAGQSKQGDSSKGTRQRTPQICKGHRTHGKGRERSGPAAGQRAPREGMRGSSGELLAVLHTIGQSAVAHGSWSGFTGTQACGRCEARPGAAGEAGDSAAQARSGVEVWVVRVVYCSTTRRQSAGRILHAACASSACCLFVVGRKLHAG